MLNWEQADILRTWWSETSFRDLFYISRIQYFAQSIFLLFLFNIYSLEFLTFCPQEIMVFTRNIPFKNVYNYALQSLLVPHIANMCISMCISICVSAYVYQHIPPHKCNTYSNKTSIGKLTSDSPLLTIVDIEWKKEGTPGV